MSRLTEKEIEQISRARRVVRDEAANVDALIRQAKAMRYEIVTSLMKRGIGAIVPVAAFRLLGDLFVTPVARAIRRRRTLRELERLDDRMLADIGLERYTLRDYAWTLDAARHPETRPAPWVRFARWLEQRATIERLEAMDDRLLADIGLARGNITDAVTGRERPAKPAQGRLGAVIREAENRLPRGTAWTLNKGAARKINGLDSEPLSETGYVKARQANRERASAA